MLHRHPAIRAIAKAITGTPYQGRVFLVGGSVRDHLLQPSQTPDAPQIKHKTNNEDYDLVTDLPADQLAHLLFEKGLSKIPPQTYPRFGTAMLHVRKTKIELVSARRESYAHHSRKPEVAPATFLDDALRRDFTVNALLADIQTGEVQDPLRQGLPDLEARLLRTPLDPAQTFHDDPLRMLRAVRFRHRLGFQYAPGLAEAIRRSAPRLDIVSPERVNEEFTKILLHPAAPAALQDLLDLELLPRFAPELAAMAGVTQGKWHHADVWHHTLQVLANAQNSRTNRSNPDEPDLTLFLAALLHDVGKPKTRSIDEKGDIRFFSHESVGADIARDLLLRLKYSRDTAEDVALLVMNHMRTASIAKLSDSAARRIVRDLGPHLDRWLELIESDANALRAGVRTLDVPALRTRLGEVQAQTPAAKLDSPLSGREIMRLAKLTPGPAVGKLKNLLAEAVIEGEIPAGDKPAARAFLRQHLSQNPMP